MNTLKTEQAPIFLRGVEENPKPSVYRDLIENAKAAGTDYWQIWHLLAFDPEAAHHLAALSHTLMHRECPISAGLRELIAAYTSSLNQCEFCMKAHAAVASQLLANEALVWSVIRTSTPPTSTTKRRNSCDLSARSLKLHLPSPQQTRNN
jgi:AhpD family alkylhydroperoxidase